jgi:uncharacterized protein (DUF4415 family)
MPPESSLPGNSDDEKEPRITRASLAELRRRADKRKAEGDIVVPPDLPGEELPEGFWDDAVLEMPPPRSVHLKLDYEVFDFFKSQGKGHLTRMQNVLKAYVRAQRRG